MEKTLHPLEKLLQEFQISRYELSKRGISQSTTSSIITRNTKVDDMAIGTVMQLANALDLDLEGVYARLKGYEKN